ncbi:MAG: hypothetical protein RR085_11720 [Clostridia bacterium]
MFNKAPQNNELRRVMDACLPGLENKPDFERDVLRQVRGEVKVKKKLSVGLVLIIVIVLVVAAALAVVTLRETAQIMAQTEQESGCFHFWPLEKKLEVVTALVEQGYIEKTDELAQAMEGKQQQDEASRIADEAVSKFVGLDASEIGFMVLMQAAWGPFDQWTHEERTWYSQVMESIGIESDGKTFYVEPTGSIREQQAVAIARNAIAKSYGVQESVLDSYSHIVSFQVPEFAEQGNKQAYWYVAFTAPDALAKEKRLFHDMELYIHPETGELLQSVDELRAKHAKAPKPPDNALYQAIGAYHKRAHELGHDSFREWPLSLRAEYSKEIVPKVKAIIESGDLSELMNCGSLDTIIIAQSTYLYGVAQADAISQDKAFDLAKTALEEAYGLTPKLLSLYGEVGTYYDITDASTPLWKFLFNPKTLPEREIENGFDNPLFNLCYKVEINAYTGETVHIEEFAFQTPGQSLQYDLKWY